LSFEYWSVSAREVGFGDVNRGVFLSGSDGIWTDTPPASDMSTSAIVVDAVVDGSSRHRIQSDQRREEGRITHAQKGLLCAMAVANHSARMFGHN